MKTLPAEVRPANPGTANETSAMASTRRGFFGVIAAAPLVGFSPPAQARSSLDLEATLRAYQSAESRNSAFNNDVFEPAETAWSDACDALPHHRTKASFLSIGGEQITLSTDDPHAVKTAQRLLSDINNGKLASEHGTDYEHTLREVIDADDARQAEMKRLRKVHNLDAIEATQNDLAVAADTAFKAVLCFPAASVHDLRVKVEFLEAEYAWAAPGAQEGILADIRRLAAQEGA